MLTKGQKSNQQTQQLNTVKPVLSGHSKRRTKIGFQDRLSLNAGQVLQNAPREHSAILSTFIKLPFVFKTFVLAIYEWPLKTGFTVYHTMPRLFWKLTISHGLKNVSLKVIFSLCLAPLII